MTSVFQNFIIIETILAKKKVLKASITCTTNNFEKSDILAKVEQQLFEKNCNKLKSDCSNIFYQIFLIVTLKIMIKSVKNKVPFKNKLINCG